jgi:hypothetical protein
LRVIACGLANFDKPRHGRIGEQIDNARHSVPLRGKSLDLRKTQKTQQTGDWLSIGDCPISSRAGWGFKSL